MLELMRQPFLPLFDLHPQGFEKRSRQLFCSRLLRAQTCPDPGTQWSSEALETACIAADKFSYSLFRFACQALAVLFKGRVAIWIRFDLNPDFRIQGLGTTS